MYQFRTIKNTGASIPKLILLVNQSYETLHKCNNISTSKTMFIRFGSIEEVNNSYMVTDLNSAVDTVMSYYT